MDAFLIKKQKFTLIIKSICSFKMNNYDSPIFVHVKPAHPK